MPTHLPECVGVGCLLSSSAFSFVCWKIGAGSFCVSSEVFQFRIDCLMEMENACRVELSFIFPSGFDCPCAVGEGTKKKEKKRKKETSNGIGKNIRVLGNVGNIVIPCSCFTFDVRISRRTCDVISRRCLYVCVFVFL